MLLSQKLQELKSDIIEEVGLNNSIVEGLSRCIDDAQFLESEQKELHNIRLSCYKEQSKKEGWISVEERLPEENILVLGSRLFGGGNRDYRLTYINHHGIFDDLLNNITHWMPLPNAPKEQSKNKGGEE